MKSVKVSRDRVLDPGSFPMKGFACDSCNIWCVLDNNAHFHERKNHGHKMEEAMIHLEESKYTPPNKETLYKYLDTIEHCAREGVCTCDKLRDQGLICLYCINLSHIEEIRRFVENS